MRVIINASNLSSGGGLAIGSSILKEWLACFRDELLVLSSKELAAHLTDFPESSLVIADMAPASGLKAAHQFRRVANHASRNFRPDVCLTIFGPALWRPDCPHLCGFANGLYLHPLNEIAPVSPSGFAKIEHRIKSRIALFLLRHHSDAVWTESADAAGRLREHLGSVTPIHVIPNTLHSIFAQRATASGVTRQNSGSAFHLAIPGTALPHKNLQLVKQILAMQEKGTLCFHVTLPVQVAQAVFGPLLQDGSVVNHGLLAPEQLPEYYKQTDAVFAPSLSEIHSAVWDEAASMGLPLICSAIPSAMKYCGEAAAYFDPRSPEDAFRRICLIRDAQDAANNLVKRAAYRIAGLPTAQDRLFMLRGILTEMHFQKNQR